MIVVYTTYLGQAVHWTSLQTFPSKNIPISAYLFVIYLAK